MGQPAGLMCPQVEAHRCPRAAGLANQPRSANGLVPRVIDTRIDIHTGFRVNRLVLVRGAGACSGPDLPTTCILAFMLPVVLLGVGVLAAGALLSKPKPKPKRIAKAAKKPSRAKSATTWQAAEKKACKVRKRKHLGGPGRADCAGGIEVKSWKRAVDAGTVKREHAKGRKEIVAASGFTGPAKSAARKRGIKLSTR